MDGNKAFLNLILHKMTIQLHMLSPLVLYWVIGNEDSRTVITSKRNRGDV